MGTDTFMLDGIGVLRHRIEKDASGKVTALTELYDDGRTDTYPRGGS
jgi:hypothetical protein